MEQKSQSWHVSRVSCFALGIQFGNVKDLSDDGWNRKVYIPYGFHLLNPEYLFDKIHLNGL